MVLVWGLPEDGPTAQVLEELRRQRVPVAWVNQQESAASRIELELSINARGILHLPDGSIDLSEVRGAYVRPYDFRMLEVARGLCPDSPDFQQCRAFEESLHLWGETTTATVMNRFSAMASNGSKPYQTDIIRQYGFSVPETLITTDPKMARAFWDKHGSVIYKSMSGQRSIVATLEKADRRRLSKVARCPTQFQARIPGIDYRVHVVADHIFACRIRSTATDHRYDSGTIIESAEVPVEIADRCYRLTRGLGLELSGVDLRQTPEGEWFCFEVNPSPGFTYYEDATGLPIGAAIAAALGGSAGSE